MPVLVESPLVRLTLFGALDAWTVTREHLLPRGRKARAVLAVLGMAAGRPVPRTRLACLLWSRVPMNQARASLRQALHEVTMALAPAGLDLLSPGRDAVTLYDASLWVDALEVARTTPERPDALDLMAQPLLEGMDGLDPVFDVWLNEERASLVRHGARVARAAFDASAPAQRRTAAQRLLRIDPIDVEAARSLAIDLSASGDRTTAVSVVDALLHALRQDGQAPDPTIVALRRDLRVGSVATPTETMTPDAGPNVAAPIPSGPRRGIRLGVPPLSILGSGVESYLAEGLANEITTALARFRWLFLADPATLAAGVDPGPAAARMNLDSLLLGSVQRFGSRVRVTLRLVDLRSEGEVLWSGRFDRDGEDPLALQDNVAAAVVARLDPELLLIEARRAAVRPPVDPSAHDLVLRAVPALYSLDRAAFVAAEDLLAQAIIRDPGYATAQAWYAWWHLFLVGQGWTDDHAASLKKAESLAARATMLDPSDALALTVRGHVLAYLNHLPEEGCALHDRALALNPNLSLAWALSGLAYCYAGRHEEALRRLDRYAELAPLHPLGFFLDAARPVPLMLLGRHAEAVDAARAAAALHPRFSFPLRPWLASLGWLDRQAEANTVRERLLALEPGLTIARALLRAPLRPKDRDTYAEGLRRAGLVVG